MISVETPFIVNIAKLLFQTTLTQTTTREKLHTTTDNHTRETTPDNRTRETTDTPGSNHLLCDLFYDICSVISTKYFSQSERRLQLTHEKNGFSVDQVARDEQEG